MTTKYQLMKTSQQITIFEWEGEFDLGKIEKEEGIKIKAVDLVCDETKNLSFVNYSLPFSIKVFILHDWLKELKKCLNFDWILINKKVSFILIWSAERVILGKECDKFAQKITWHLMSGRGNKFGIHGIELLTDISDLDQIIEDYDYSRWGDKEYHCQLFGGDREFENLYNAFDNLTIQIIARNIIIANRLTHGEDKENEENIMTFLACGFQQIHYKISRSKVYPKVYSEMKSGEAEMKLQELIDKALAGDKELLGRLQDLPFLAKEFQFSIVKDLRQQIQTLEGEVEIHLEALEVSEVWNKRQIKEITDQKDQEIKELKEIIRKKEKADKETQTDALILIKNT